MVPAASTFTRFALLHWPQALDFLLLVLALGMLFVLCYAFARMARYIIVENLRMELDCARHDAKTCPDCGCCFDALGVLMDGKYNQPLTSWRMPENHDKMSA